ncbi:gas vesicle structural protein GvpA [Streptomyces] [Streptomyces violaceorubidus]
MTESGARGKSKGALSGAAETISDAFKQARDEGGSERETSSRPRARKAAPSRRKEEQE